MTVINQQKVEKIIKARGFIKDCITSYLKQHSWQEVTTCTITPLTGACETIATVFPMNYFNQMVHLSQTGQLELEYLVKTLRTKVWTFDHSFRMEERVTQRHLTEFTMFELESPNFTLHDIMSTHQDIFKFIVSQIRENENIIDFIPKERLNYLYSINYPFRICEYNEAIRILLDMGFKVDYHSNLGIDEETALLKFFNYQPFFITMYPADIKYFNMKRTASRDKVYSIDLIAPPFGEVSGGAERETRFDDVVNNLKKSQMWMDIERFGYNRDHFEWYLSLWSNGSPGPRGGFGIGFERYVAIFTGESDILNCIEFPRNRNVIFP